MALADGAGEGCVVVWVAMGRAADTGGDGVWNSVKATRIIVSVAMMMSAIPEGPILRAAFWIRPRVFTARTLRDGTCSAYSRRGNNRADRRTFGLGAAGMSSLGQACAGQSNSASEALPDSRRSNRSDRSKPDAGQSADQPHADATQPRTQGGRRGHQPARVSHCRWRRMACVLAGRSSGAPPSSERLQTCSRR